MPRSNMEKIQKSDLLNDSSILFDVKTGMARTHTSRYALMRLGKESGALIYVGDKPYFYVKRLVQYIEELTK